MTPEQFCYWLQGIMECMKPTELNAEQTAMVKDHLKLVFDKKTPDYSEPIRPPRKPLPINHWPDPPRRPPMLRPEPPRC